MLTYKTKLRFDTEEAKSFRVKRVSLILYGADGNILHGTNDRIVYADQLT